jgi:hypothetical protein
MLKEIYVYFVYLLLRVGLETFYVYQGVKFIASLGKLFNLVRGNVAIYSLDAVIANLLTNLLNYLNHI